MNRTAEATTILCSHIGAGDTIQPLNLTEFNDLARRLRDRKINPSALLDFSRAEFLTELDCTEGHADRLMRLIGRAGALAMALEEYRNMGIEVVTRSELPQLRKRLGSKCPPLFYYAGDLSLLDYGGGYAGYVGSRHIAPEGEAFTRRMVEKTAAHGYGVVSGGAKGIDTISMQAARDNGVPVIGFLSDSLKRKLKDTAAVREIRDGRMLLLSDAIPTAGFNVGMAMARNKYIYAQSRGTVVVRADAYKGGTWSGAVENLGGSITKRKTPERRNPVWCPLFVRDCEEPGNQALIAWGGIPINENWDGNVEAAAEPEPPKDKPEEQGEQMNLFETPSAT